jgi:hypothetical protein
VQDSEKGDTELAMSISNLLDKLSDPFRSFPVLQVADQLDEHVQESHQRISDRHGWWGIAEKYLPIQSEHDYEVIECLIGSAFVLAQCAITQSVSICSKIYELANKPVFMPSTKIDILQMQAAIHPETNTSVLLLIDAVANYFKHHHEWPDEWIPGPKQQQNQTIARVVQLGMCQHSRYNLQNALGSLQLSVAGENSIESHVQEWRVNLSKELRKQFLQHGFAVRGEDMYY